MTWRNISGYIGSILFMASPLLLFPWTKSTEIGPEVMNIAAWTVALTLPILMIIAIKAVPDGMEVSTRRVQMRDFIKSIKINKPFYRYIAASVVGGIGGGIWMATFFIYIDIYLGIGDKFIYILLVAWITRILVAPIWLRWLYRFGKHRVWAVGTILSGSIVPFAVLITPGESALVPVLIYALVLGFIDTAMLVAPYAVFGDVIDYDTLKTGSNKASSYYAVAGLVLKSISGIGGAVGMFLLSVFDFNIKGGNTFHQNIGLFLAIGVAPGIMYILSGLIIKDFPIDEKRQNIIKRRIESRAKRNKVCDIKIS